MSDLESGGKRLFFDSMGRGTRVVPKLLPDFFPKVGGLCPGLAVGSVGSGNLTWSLTTHLLSEGLFSEVTDSCRQTCLTSLGVYPG